MGSVVDDNVQSSEELARTFAVAMTLKALSLRLNALPTVRTHLDCWWAQSSELGFCQAFEANHQVRSSHRLAADHYAIVGHAELLDTVLQRLHAVAVPAF